MSGFNSSDRPDIAIFLPSLHAGGAEKAMIELANGLSGRGHRVDLVVCQAEGFYLQQVAEGVNLVDLGARRVAGAILPLARYVRRFRPKTLVSALTHCNVIAVLGAAIARTDLRLYLSERSNLSQATRDARSARDRLLPLFVRWLYPRAARIICVSDGVARDLRVNHAIAPTLLVTIPNAVDPVRLRTIGRDAPGTDIEAFKAGHPLIVAVGRLDPAKDHATLLSAFQMVRQSHDARLAIVGEGPLRRDLTAEIKRLGLEDSVRLAGFDPLPTRWMVRCDVYAHSSRREGFPNALVEALACGARVVATDCPSGPSEILESGKWGRLVPVGNPRALADALIAALAERAPVEMDRVGRYSADAVLDAYERCLALRSSHGAS